MTRSDKLRQKIQSSGYKYKYIADVLGLSYYGLKRKIDNKNFFNTKEVQELCEILKISTDEKEYIFFAPDVQKSIHRIKVKE